MMTMDWREMSKSFLIFLHEHYIIVRTLVGIVLGYIMIRQWIAGRRRTTAHARIDGATVLITGGNSGIGKATAKEMMKKGARVIIACRDMKKGQEAMREIKSALGKNDNSSDVRHLDLSSLRCVREFAESFLKEEKKLDILINNAGVFCPRWESKDGYELQFAVNHLGHFLLTILLLDLLKASAPSRIVNVSSDAYKHGKLDFDDIGMKNNYAPFESYSRSKLANVLFTRALTRRLQGTGVTSNAVHPGMTNTNIVRNIGKEYTNTFKRRLISMVKWIFLIFGNTAEHGAKTVVFCATDSDLQSVSGKYFSNCREMELAPHASDQETQERLWRVSEQMVKLTKRE